MDSQAVQDKYLHSGEFARFVDEDLRRFAEECVQKALEAMEHEANKLNKSKVTKVKKTQLHSIPAVVQVGGSSKLIELADNQSKKHSKPENRAFWAWLKLVVAPQGDEPQGTLPGLIMGHMRGFGFELPDPKEIKERPKRRAQRKENEAVISPVKEQVLPIFCEHFLCHYTYIVKEE